MLDRNTWTKTVSELNKIAGVHATAYFYKFSGTGEVKEEIRLISLFRIRGLFAIEWILRTFLIIRKEKGSVIFVDIFTFPVVIISRLIGLDHRFILDLRTLYFNFSDTENWSLRNLFYKYWTRVALWFCSKFNIEVSVIVPELQSYISSLGFRDPIKSFIWSSGFDAEDFSNADLTRKDENLLLLYHGHITENRGLLSCLDAISDLKLLIPSLEYHIYGTGPYLQELKKAIAVKGYGSFVKYKGVVDYELIPELLKSADLALMNYPKGDYWNYNNPIKFSEYLASGVLIIHSEIPSFVRFLENYHSYILNDKSSVEDVIKSYAIQKKENDSELLKLRQENRTRVIEEHTWSAKAKTIYNYLSNESPLHNK